MVLEELVVGAVPMAAGVIIVSELFCLLKVNHQVRFARHTALKAFAIVTTPKISDHWKEKVLPWYASKLLVSTLGILICLCLLFLFFVIAYGMAGLLFFENVKEGIEQLMNVHVQLSLIGIGILYGVLRKRILNG